jgi:dTDP-4-amino-4,6-dideoxygalactose transaminase
MPVHLFGQPADMDRSAYRAAISRRIGDACQAWRYITAGAGSIGIGCFSFYPVNLGRMVRAARRSESPQYAEKMTA